MISESLKRIQKHQEQINHHQQEINAIKRNCSHSFDGLTEKQKADEHMCLKAICWGCGSCFGWRCKESPDQVCHYYSRNGRVELIYNDSVPVPEGYDPCNECYEICIFCGEPRERK